MNDILIESLIEYLKCKSEIADLEKDILDTAHILSANPFDIIKAKSRVLPNNAKYLDLYPTITAMPTTTNKPMAQADEVDVRYNLSCQLELMCAKLPVK